MFYIRKEKKMKRKKNRMDMLAQQILAMQEELEEVNKPESESEHVKGLSELLWRFQFISPRWRCWSTWRRRTQWNRWSPPGNQSWRDQQKRFHKNHFSILHYKHCMREQQEKFIASISCFQLSYNFTSQIVFTRNVLTFHI